MGFFFSKFELQPIELLDT